MYLADTNVIIGFLKGREPDTDILKVLLEDKKVSLSSLTLAELFAGATLAESKKIVKLMRYVSLIPVGKEIAMIGGTYRKHYSKKINRVYLLDCLIAATCKENKLTLITNNVKDYPMKDITILKPKDVFQN